MINEILLMNGHGLYVWSAFAFTSLSALAFASGYAFAFASWIGNCGASAGCCFASACWKPTGRPIALERSLRKTSAILLTEAYVLPSKSLLFSRMKATSLPMRRPSIFTRICVLTSAQSHNERTSCHDALRFDDLGAIILPR